MQQIMTDSLYKRSHEIVVIILTKTSLPLCSGLSIIYHVLLKTASSKDDYKLNAYSLISVPVFNETTRLLCALPFATLICSLIPKQRNSCYLVSKLHPQCWASAIYTSISLTVHVNGDLLVCCGQEGGSLQQACKPSYYTSTACDSRISHCGMNVC